MSNEINIENIIEPPKDDNYYQWNNLNKEWENKDPESLTEIPPSPYPSWKWNKETVHWEPPIIKPENPKNKDNWVEEEYKWEEEKLNWELVSTKPYPSWAKTKRGWVAPISLTKEQIKTPHRWNEENQQWVLFE
jgi:hypothetical protein